MKTFLILIALLTVAVDATGQQTGLIQNVGGRTAVSLDGQWKVIVDPYDTGSSNNGFFKDAQPKSKSEFVEYNFDASESLSVPGDWNSQRERLFFYEGAVWYKKSFDYQRPANSRVFAYFGAANYLADVYLNGSKVGRHEGGFTPFNFEITNLLHEKDNSLIVKVDNKRSREAVPTVMTDWWNYGGLTRQVMLIEVPQTFVQDYFIQLRRSAIILWSMANETPQGEARLSFISKLAELTRTLDPTRLVTAAMLNHYEGQTTKVIDDPLSEYLDVVGCNEYIGWYDGLPSKADNMEWKTHYQKPVVMSEFGGEAQYGRHGDDLTRWTEEYQENLYRHQIAMLKRISFLRGTAPWILKDFRSPRRVLPRFQDY